MPVSYEQEFEVYHFECDRWDRMTPGAMLRRAQEIATDQCEALGINEELYRRTHTAFFLSRISLEIYCAPQVDQQVRLQTIAYGMNKAQYHRETAMYAVDGTKLCEADSRWVLVDTESRRILRRQLAEFEPYFSDEPPAGHEFVKMKPDEEAKPLAEMQASYSLCDRNGHVNNTRYADMVCDHLPLEKLAQASPAKMVFNYHSEIPMGSRFVLHGGASGEEGFYFLAQGEASKNFEAFVRF